jgi:hypothetical protein
MADTYRAARNTSLVALTASDGFVHHITEAALDEEGGIPVDKAALITALTGLAATANENFAEAIRIASSTQQFVDGKLVGQ